VRLGFQKGFPEISAGDKTFSSLRNKLNDTNLDVFMQIHPELEMVEGDIIVNKKRVSAFSGSDLEIILHAQSISHLVLTGIATSGVTLSTLHEALIRIISLPFCRMVALISMMKCTGFLSVKYFPNKAK